MTTQSTHAPVSISMFGMLGIRSNGHDYGPADLGGVKPRDILEILLLHHGRTVTKDLLADQIWPDQAPRHVLATLESYVSVLRKNLGTLSREAGAIIETRTGAYSIDDRLVEVDVDEFDELAKRASCDPAGAIGLRTRAMALAEADLLLDAGEAVWVIAERELYRERVTRCGVLLSRDLLATGDAIGSIAAAEQALRFNPFAEEAYRLAMLANYWLGLDGVARGVHDLCREVVETRLGRDLTSATEDLAGAIDAGVPVDELLREVVGERCSSVHIGGRSSDRRTQVPELAFVGRSREIEHVVGAIERGHSGESVLVVVRGSVGSGRTSFLDEIAAHRPFAVGRQRFVEDDRHHPGVPLAQPLLEALAERACDGAVQAYGALPWLGVGTWYLWPLIALIEQHGPVTLLLDDLQYADQGVIKCLELLFDIAPHLPIAVVATVSCPTELDHVDLSGLSLAPSYEVVQLGPLDGDALAHLDADLVRFTGGVPALLADAWRWNRSGHCGVSPSMRHRVLSEVRGLGHVDRALLTFTSTLCEPFDAATIAGGLGLGVDEVLRRCEQFVERNHFARQGSGFRFRATVVRQLLAEVTAVADPPPFALKAVGQVV